MAAESNMNSRYSTRSAGVKRLMKEAAELREPTELYYAQPLEDNLFEWHFTVRGPADSDFDGGIYHGRIIFPTDYPMNPPNLILLTPNGRFELSKKICLSISGYHPETWLPSWSTLIGFMPTEPAGAVGSLDYPPIERRRLAKLSLEWKCKECNLCMRDALLPLTEQGRGDEQEAKELVKSTGESQQESQDATSSASQSTTSGNVMNLSGPSTERPAPPRAAVRQATRAEESSEFTWWILFPVVFILIALSATLIARRAVA